ncbi:hypothetical protein LX16_5198 [Stackebrandtia albiflava]|uniref:Uncharacterized protein n=1 Tax=Stackebrandtia albiflava TaxID=406432 RepID=A0A562ULH9_9ACTN|nr:hypothetical protein [Stackebrandtia albiflava]TWJ06462.1 hypothetical protein LX16_5198 [Stackebrandtia albiflava]
MNGSASGVPPHTSTTANFAAHGATVGIQAREVHHATVYQVAPDSSPQEKYRVGLRYLEDGVPVRAEELISEAIAGGHDSAEVRFHWVLAMLSKRAYRDLSRQERDRLGAVARDGRVYPDEHMEVLDAVRELLRHLEFNEGDHQSAEKRILELPPGLRTKIDRHLGLVLSGAVRDELWRETKANAETERFGNGRRDRMWAYFHPIPAPPRTKPADPSKATPADRLRARISTSLFGALAAYLGWLTLGTADVLPLFAFPSAVVAGFIGARHGFEWCYSARRIDSENRDYRRHTAIGHLRGTGFAKAVSVAFDHYFVKYRPHGVGVEAWLHEIADIRGRLRKEVAGVYRETGIPVGRVKWLIGYLARDARTRWRNGELYAHLERYRIALSTRVHTLLGLSVVLSCAVVVAVSVLRIEPLAGAMTIIGIAATGTYAARKWEFILREQRREAEDMEDCERRHADRLAEYRRWKAKLDATRPSENEMETWLQCDRTVLIDNALRHYRLSWRDVVSHAVFQGPAKGRTRARVSGGPWRFSKYALRLFLITEDGVREVASELDFRAPKFIGEQRDNYRFEAVSSVRVESDSGKRLTMKLTLMNGPARGITVTESEELTADAGDEPKDLQRINLAASGFAHALRLLEGIAAEGKGWLERDGAAGADGSTVSIVAQRQRE